MKQKKIYSCTQCGYETTKWLGKCPQCEEWNTFEEGVKNMGSGKQLSQLKKTVEPMLLHTVLSRKDDRIKTNINEFNRVIGGGIVRDSLTILSSPPGGGKSTLTLSIANDVASQGMKVLYATGEESESQIKNRADRILGNIEKNIWIIADTSLDNVLNAINDIDPDLIIIDSIQTFALEEFLPARAGNPTQTMECATELVRVAKTNRGRAVIIIGQMNKNNDLAGLRSLEHVVDTVLIMDGDIQEELRSIVATKNRFGSTGEAGFFLMTEKGLVSVDNPSEYFMTKRDCNDKVCGSAMTVIREGSRPIIAEIESLVSSSFAPYPSRICEAFKRDQLNTLVSILEQRGGIPLYDKNIVVKTTGGIKLKEQSSNLAVIMSIASSVFDLPISSNTAFISDVGLTGELKRVPSVEARIKELDRMGFEYVYIASGGIRPIKLENIKVVECKTLKDVMGSIFQNRRSKK